jgi:hypothetical protein
VVSSGGAGLLVTNAPNGIFAGNLNGAIGLGILGNNALTLESVQGYTGLTVRSGNTLVLRDDAALSATSGIELNTASLVLDNTASLQIQNNNRLNDDAPLTLRSGLLTLNGRAKAAAAETVGPTTAAMGANR